MLCTLRLSLTALFSSMDRSWLYTSRQNLDCKRDRDRVGGRSEPAATAPAHAQGHARRDRRGQRARRANTGGNQRKGREGEHTSPFFPHPAEDRGNEPCSAPPPSGLASWPSRRGFRPTSEGLRPVLLPAGPFDVRDSLFPGLVGALIAPTRASTLLFFFALRVMGSAMDFPMAVRAPRTVHDCFSLLLRTWFLLLSLAINCPARSAPESGPSWPPAPSSIISSSSSDSSPPRKA
mmetsp:Transcript_68730/g.217365  ORF Transcript_68730/g.217365 Transcript_68730/m.217365 type:complete len:235 (+) Transcript_68730:313-1017(+)